jgi:hypothetical protein
MRHLQGPPLIVWDRTNRACTVDLPANQVYQIPESDKLAIAPWFRMLKKAKRWSAVAEDVEPFPEHQREIGKALPADQKKHLFQVAGSKPS